MPIRTTTIGACPKPDYVPIPDWFREESTVAKDPTRALDQCDECRGPEAAEHGPGCAVGTLNHTPENVRGSDIRTISARYELAKESNFILHLDFYKRSVYSSNQTDSFKLF